MNEIVNLIMPGMHLVALVAVITLPIWGFKVIQEKFLGKHRALRVTHPEAGNFRRSTSILASVGTTSAGVFLIQTLPLIFGMVDDVGSTYGVQTVYSDYFADAGVGEFVDGFYGLTAELSGMLQTAAPMAAVGLGGYNLLNNLSRGIPAIKKS